MTTNEHAAYTRGLTDAANIIAGLKRGDTSVYEQAIRKAAATETLRQEVQPCN